MKAAFTRAYNKEGHMTPYASVQVKKGRSKDTPDDQEALLDEDALEEDEEEPSEDPSLDAMIKVKKESKKTATSTVQGKKKAPAATRGRGGAGSRGGRKKAVE